MRLKRTEQGCSPIVGGESGYGPEDKHVGNDYLGCCLSGIASGSNGLRQYMSLKSRGM
jgi:hypothetical protein